MADNRTGWICPQCRRGMAPWMASCNCVTRSSGTTAPARSVLGMCHHGMARANCPSCTPSPGITVSIPSAEEVCRDGDE